MGLALARWGEGAGKQKARGRGSGEEGRVDQGTIDRGELLPPITSVRDQAKGLANNSTRATTRP
jgi:hypothetical protein